MEINAIKTNRSFSKVYWIFHTSWWLFIICVELLRHVEAIFTHVSIEIFIYYFDGSLAGLTLHLIFTKIKYKSFSMVTLSSVIIITSMIASYLWAALDGTLGVFLMKLFIYNASPYDSTDLLGFPFFYAVLLTTYSGIYFTLKIWIEWTNQKSQTEKAILMAQSAQLQMLRYQLNPHFIFNSLSSIRALVENEKAEMMITKLSEFLRYTIDEENKNEVPLIDEIEVAKNYLDIEKVRFGDQLIINYNIDYLSEDYPVPAFLINPLIENSIKHGMNTGKLPLVLDINTKITDDDALEIEVVNTGHLTDQNHKQNKDSTQTGLTNVRKRLEFLYPNSFLFKLYESNARVHAKIILKKKLHSNHGN